MALLTQFFSLSQSLSFKGFKVAVESKVNNSSSTGTLGEMEVSAYSAMIDNSYREEDEGKVSM